MTKSMHVFFWLILITLLSSCAPTYQQWSSQQSEILVLQDGSEVPCTIVDYDEYDLVIKPVKSSDLYKYGEVIPIGNVNAVQFMRGSEMYSAPIDDYLDKYFEGSSKSRIPKPSRSSEAENVDTNEPDDDDADADTTEENGVGVNIKPFFADSTAALQATGVGLNLSGRFTPEKAETSVEYQEIADLLVSAGASGLVLYRAGRNNEIGVELTEAQQSLVDAIDGSELWSERKKGIRNAHRIASAGFTKATPEALKERFEFKSAGMTDPFIQFMIFLRKQGDLRSPTNVDNAVELFGEQATSAIQDLLANFDDWYYVVVIPLLEN